MARTNSANKGAGIRYLDNSVYSVALVAGRVVRAGGSLVYFYSVSRAKRFLTELFTVAGEPRCIAEVVKTSDRQSMIGNLEYGLMDRPVRELVEIRELLGKARSIKGEAFFIILPAAAAIHEHICARVDMASRVHGVKCVLCRAGDIHVYASTLKALRRAQRIGARHGLRITPPAMFERDALMGREMYEVNVRIGTVRGALGRVNLAVPLTWANVRKLVEERRACTRRARSSHR